MTSVGENLRRERIKRKLALDQIASELKISSRFLEAIESEQFEKLPGGVFAKSFVRQYARLLGLDEDELAGEVQRILDPPELTGKSGDSHKIAPAEIHVPRVEAWQAVGENRFNWSSSLPALAMVVVMMLACSLVYSWWQRSRHGAPAAHEASAQAAQSAEATSAPPPTIPQPGPAEASGQAPAQSSPATTPPADANSADRPAGDTAAAAATQPAAPPPVTVPQPVSAAREAPESAAAQPAETPAAVHVPASAAGPVRVELTAQEPVWVLAQTDGKYSFSGTLEANQTRVVQANSTVTLRLGNAGGVSISLNGKPVGSVGPKGQVRTVQFTSGGFQIVAAPKPSLPLDPLL